MHIHDHRHPHLLAYQDKESKALIRGIKLLDPTCLDEGARLLHTYICMDKGVKGRILLLHAPSSAYANGERTIDQVLALLKRIAAMHCLSSCTAHRKTRPHIDIMPHFFILNHDRRNAQHDAGREARIANAKTKFKILRPVPEALLMQYDQIDIIDDVSTTGHTLHALMELMKASYPAISARISALSIAH